jgi:hypothetical protein
MQCMVGGTLTCGSLLASRAEAQSRIDISLDGSIGFAASSGGEFVDRGLGNARLAIGIRDPFWETDRGSVGLDAEVSYDWFGLGGHDAICTLDPRGGCIPSFPTIGGTAALFGMSLESEGTIQARLLAGPAAYSLNGTRVGAMAGNLDVAWFPVWNLGLVLGGRETLIPRYRHDALSLLGWTLGIRLRTGAPVGRM